MNLCNKAIIRLLVIGASSSLLYAQTVAKPAATIRRITAFRAGSSVEIEISADRPLTPEAQIVTGPDRLVVDFSNSLPGADLRPLAGIGEMTSVRASLYKSNPPVTRVVLDLKSPQPYQLFPSGNNVIIKLSGNNAAIASAPPIVASDDMPATLPPIKRAVKLDVQFQNGNLSIWANKATLAEILFEVHKRTGADIAIPAGAEQEQVVAKIGPLPPREAMAALLEGSRFNFIMVGAEGDSSLHSVILSVRGGGASSASTYTPPQPAVAQAAVPEPVVEEPDEPVPYEPPQPGIEGAEAAPPPGGEQQDPSRPPR